MTSRSFTIEKSDIKFKGGRYISTQPLLAAKKAAHRLFDEAEKSGKAKTITHFHLRETSRGSDKKIYFYIGKKEKLDVPKVIKIAGNNVTYTHTYSVKADVEAEAASGSSAASANL